jgi:signal transduction histidine kinase
VPFHLLGRTGNPVFEALLDMTKLEAGILQANPAEFAVQRLLDRIETTFAELADKKGLSLRVVPCSAWVRSDPILLERILVSGSMSEFRGKAEVARPGDEYRL